MLGDGSQRGRELLRFIVRFGDGFLFGMTCEDVLVDKGYRIYV